MNERIKITKDIYPNYLVLISKKNKYLTNQLDKQIIDLFSDESVNKIILNNLEIKEIKEYDNNLYNFYYTKVQLIYLLEEFRKDLRK